MSDSYLLLHYFSFIRTLNVTIFSRIHRLFSFIKMDHSMINFRLIFLFVALFSTLTEGQLDIKCVNGKKQSIPISYFVYGNVYSPGYTEGKPYTNEMSCQVNLIAEKGKFIRLTFNHIDVTNNTLCRDDNLSVFEHQADNSSVKVGQYCGNMKVYDYVSLNNILIITFSTTYVGTGMGFNITYREVSTQDICKAGEFQCRSRRCIPKEGILCNGKDDCGDGTDEEDCNYPLPVPSECGIPDQEPFTGNAMVDRIVGGREAVRGSWPWQVDMQLGTILPNGHICGGSLINAQWFVTAAHCVVPVRKPFMARIHLGNHHKYKEDPYEEVRYLKDFFVYGVNKEEFVKTGAFHMSHDLALVKLNAPVLMNPHIKVVCLPQVNEELKSGEKCFATGWGMTRGSGSDHVLKQAVHPIQNETRCFTIFQKFERETMICAGRLEPLNGLCHGDSGGPLVCKKNGKWHVYGAASFVTDTNFVEGLCGIANKPTVFNKISPKIQWIQSTIANNS